MVDVAVAVNRTPPCTARSASCRAAVGIHRLSRSNVRSVQVAEQPAVVAWSLNMETIVPAATLSPLTVNLSHVGQRPADHLRASELDRGDRLAAHGLGGHPQPGGNPGRLGPQIERPVGEVHGLVERTVIFVTIGRAAPSLTLTEVTIGDLAVTANVSASGPAARRRPAGLGRRPTP